MRTDGSDFFCGMTFPVGDKYCTFIVGGWGGGTTGLSNVDDFNAGENETTGFTEFKNDQWYTIRLRVTDEKIQAWIDKRQVVDLQREGKSLTSVGARAAAAFGIGNWHTSSQLRAITLTRLKGDAQTADTKTPDEKSP